MHAKRPTPTRPTVGSESGFRPFRFGGLPRIAEERGKRRRKGDGRWLVSLGFELFEIIT